jgi:hypothetical protein
VLGRGLDLVEDACLAGDGDLAACRDGSIAGDKPRAGDAAGMLDGEPVVASDARIRGAQGGCHQESRRVWCPVRGEEAGKFFGLHESLDRGCRDGDRFGKRAVSGAVSVEQHVTDQVAGCTHLDP